MLGHTNDWSRPMVRSGRFPYIPQSNVLKIERLLIPIVVSIFGTVRESLPVMFIAELRFCVYAGKQ